MQVHSIKKKEEAERRRMEESHRDAIAKEHVSGRLLSNVGVFTVLIVMFASLQQLMQTIEEKKSEVERLQRQMEVMKERDADAAKQSEMVQELKVSPVIFLSLCEL